MRSACLTGQQQITRRDERRNLVANPFHVLDEHLLGSSVIQFAGTAIGVPGYLLSNLKGTFICKQVSNARCAKTVCRIMLLQAGLAHAPLESCWRPPSQARGRSENVPEPRGPRRRHLAGKSRPSDDLPSEKAEKA